MLSENDYIGAYYIDTLQIHCHSECIDSLFSKGLTTVLLGSMMDPVMGRTDANLFTQLHVSSTNHYFGDEPVIDSVVLQLAYNGYYGDTTTTQTVHVYELADTLSGYDNYYQFSDVEVKGFDLANNFQFQPRPKTTRIVVGNDTLSQAVLRIPLDNSFAEQLATADSAIFSTPDAFKNYFYGLKICCESVSQNGAICYFNPTSNTVTRLQVYYRETPDANPMRYDFYITSDDVYFNQYLHDYTLGSAEFTQQVLQNDTLMGQTQLYLQSMGGIRSFISFPDLLDWANALQEDGTHLIINEAKLIIPASETIDTTLLAPTTLAVISLKKTGGTALLPDYMEGTSYYGGSYSSTKKNVTFRISEYLQGIILGSENSKGLYLSIAGASYNAQRWVIAGPDANQNQTLKCEIKYSLVKE
ncbi:MAG: DUF4270 domain-containing protein [Bacteroidales bacterium]|nr:DUF4270 domain-containing protein [Bacteroidales bacterium]